MLPYILLLLLPSLSLLPSTAESNLILDYYNKTCPNFFDIMKEAVTNKQRSDPTTAAATLRLFYQDCMVGGCDASVLIATNAFNTAQRDADINLSLPGDGFELITRAKTALELQCPGVVSCADILAVAARDMVAEVGGPHYEVLLGRKDSLTSKVSDVEGNIPRPNMSLTQIISILEAKGFSLQDIVALSGAHTIGLSHCSQFSDRIFNFNKTSQFDPSIHPTFAQALQKLCENHTKDPSIAAFNDPISPDKFDNTYYSNLQKGLGLLASDQALVSDSRTRKFVDSYALDQRAFFKDFAGAMEKLSNYKVKVGRDGEVRRRCDAFNSLNTN